MSIGALGYVFMLTLPASEKWLLVCLADYADDWGDSIFPALETLEVKTGMSRSTLKRVFAKLIERGVIERLADSTGVSPAFYRIVGVPEPREFERDPHCPAVLRKAIILLFENTCEYCKRASVSKDLDPDGKPWNIDRVVPRFRGGVYSPDNVTLACRACNAKKRAKDAPPGTRTFAWLQEYRRVQCELSISLVADSASEPSGVATMDGPPVQIEPGEDPTVNPDPFTDPYSEPSQIVQAGAAPQSRHKNADENLGVITKLAHEVLDLYVGVEGSCVDDVAESVKLRCASLDIAYDSAVVYRAIDSATFQRARAGKPPVAALCGIGGDAAFRLGESRH
jgi:hypothetical protein